MINKWINSRTYTIKNGSTISFVQNLKRKITYILKDDLSDMWFSIVKNGHFDAITDEKLYDFLVELQENGIIKDLGFKNKRNRNKLLNKFVKENTTEFEYLTSQEKKIIHMNNQIGILFLELTYSCNLKCRHCCNDKDNNNKIITFENAKKLIDEAIEKGISALVLTGGECTTNKDFLKIAKYARSKCIPLEIMTNTQNLYNDKNLMNELMELYPSFCISLYSMNPAVHDYITQVNGSHYKTIEVIKKLKAKELKITINCFVMKYNYEDIKEVKKFAELINANFVKNVRFINNKKNNNINVKLTEKQIENYYYENIDLYKERIELEKGKTICNAGCKRLSITPNLDVIPCVYFNHKLGNLKENTLIDIKENSVKNFVKNFTTDKMKECYKKEYCKYCIYCSMYTTIEGNFLKKSEILCEDARAFYKAYERYKKDKKV